MSLGFLDSRSQITPLLVRLYDSHKIHGLAHNKDPEARAELITAVSELMDMELTPRESELVADVLIGLIRQAHIDLRQALAERLSTLENAPLRLILRLSNDEIEVASPVLRYSPVLSDVDLIYIINGHGPEYWRAIASRQTLSDHVMKTLVDTGDFETGRTLAENMNIKLTDYVMFALSEMARNSDDIARPLLRREELPAELVARIYRYVGEELKAFIDTHHDVPVCEAVDEKQSLAEVAEEVATEMADSANFLETYDGAFNPTDPMNRAAERFKEKGLLSTNLMMKTLRRGQFQAFVAQFSRFTGVPVDAIERVLLQKSGKGLAALCKMHRIDKADFVSIFLLTGRVRDNGHAADITTMNEIISFYNGIEKDAAQKMVEGFLIPKTAGK